MIWGLLVAVLIWLILDGMRARELALATVADCCYTNGLQLLDGAVARVHWRVARSENGRFAIMRDYGFEYSTTGNDRHQGEVQVVGRQVRQVRLGCRIIHYL